MFKYTSGKYGLVNNRYFQPLMCVYFNIQVVVYRKKGHTMVLISVSLLSLASSNVTVNQEKKMT